MRNIKLTIAYDGTNFLGWQKNSAGKSIEGTLEGALLKIVGEPCSLQAASRTDAGVHAKGQIVNFSTRKAISLYKLQKSLNGLLFDEISVLSVEEKQENFHPTLDNVGKKYQYYICNTQVQLPQYRRYSWHFPKPIDLKLVEKSTTHLIGKHDFSAFCNERSLFTRNPVCTVHSIEITPLENDRICLCIEGDRFLYKMVRNLVGTLAYVGCGKINPDHIPRILQSRQRSLAGPSAPAHGLYLERVFYTEE